METHAAGMHLRGARARVLSAVLTMLCTRWSRITDDRMRLSQLVDVITEHGGRRYDLKTIGRALASLAADELITYHPAQGRGACAVVAIHSRFVGSIEELPRDETGRVVVESVTFSDPDPSISQNPHPPTPRTSPAQPDTRPTAVNVNPNDVRTVLHAMPAVFQALPRPLRWRLGREIRNLLAASWSPEQILAVLQAPLPDDVHRPWRLALWRLRQNMPGPGPHLAALQRAWDQRIADEQRRSDADTVSRRHAEVLAVTDDTLRDGILRACQIRLPGFTGADIPRALAHAARMARREFPADTLAAALRNWVRATPEPAHQVNEPTQRTTAPTALLLTCVSCHSAAGQHRPQLPIPELSVVCDDCWHSLADPELLEDVA